MRPKSDLAKVYIPLEPFHPAQLGPAGEGCPWRE